jgi:hypothetical protein
VNAKQVFKLIRGCIQQSAVLPDVAGIVDEEVQRLGVCGKDPSDFIRGSRTRYIAHYGMTPATLDGGQFGRGSIAPNQWEQSPPSRRVDLKERSSESSTGTGDQGCLYS